MFGIICIKIMGNETSTSYSGDNPSNNNKRSTLDLFAKRIGRFNKFHTKKKKFYPVPPNAERPSAPSCPEVFQDQDQYFILRWDPPVYDGGCPIMGYVIQHLELGLPQLDSQDHDDTDAWYSSDPGQISQTECILNNLVPGTTYQFRVIAENLLGYSQPSDISEPIVFNPHGELDDWFYGPSFTMELDEAYTVMEHEMLTLSVELKGQPYPIVIWYKNEDDLVKLDSKKYRVKSSGSNRSLIINNVELCDAGSYRCVGSNKEGQVECVTHLCVEAPPRIKRVQNSDFLQNPYDVNEKEEERLNLIEDDYEDLIFQAGELVRLKFLYSGSPKPEIQVLHNGEITTDPRVITEFTEKVITVKVENILRCDRGEWLVKLDNVLGEDCTSVLITITDRPSPPGKPEILQLSDNTCILCWTTPTDDGGCPVHNYIVEYFRSEWGVWLKALTSKTLNAKIKDLIPGSKYKFRVKSENLYGVSEPSEESVEILITDSRITSGDNGGLMKTVEESIEEEEEEIQLKGGMVDKRMEEEGMKSRSSIERIFNLKAKVIKSEEGYPEKEKNNEKLVEDKKLYNRSDLIRSSVETSEDYMRRFLDQTINLDEEVDRKLASPVSFDEDEYFDEYDFEKLQKEYEEEMRLLNNDSDEFESESESEELDVVPKAVEEWDLEESVEKRIERERAEAQRERDEIQRIKRDIAERVQEQLAIAEKITLDTRGGQLTESIGQLSDSKGHLTESKVNEDEREWEEESMFEEMPLTRRNRVIKSEEKKLSLGDRFTDYLTMKVSSRNKKIGSSLRSLNSQVSNESSNKSREQSRENLRRMLDFEEDDKFHKPDLPVNELKITTNNNIEENNACYVMHASNVEVEEIQEEIQEIEEEISERIVHAESEIIEVKSRRSYKLLILLLLFFVSVYCTFKE